MILATIELAVFLVALAVIVQRERVLRRRLRRLEELRHDVHARMSRVYRHVHVVTGDRAPSAAHPVWKTEPTVQQLAGLARPLSRAGG